MEKNIKVSLLLDFYAQILSQKQRDITLNYYNNDYSLSEIAKNFNTSRQAVYDVIKRTEQYLFDIEEKLGLYNRFVQMQNTLNLIDEKLENIKTENETINNHVIEENILDIKKLVENISD